MSKRVAFLRMWLAVAFLSPLVGCFAIGWDILQPDSGMERDAGDLDDQLDSSADARQADVEAASPDTHDASGFDASDGSFEGGLSTDSGALSDASREAGTVLPCVGADCDLACTDNDPSCYASCTGSTKCKLKCGNGARCELACNSGKDCKAECSNNARCDIHCSEAEKCKVSCATGSTCTIDCSTSDCSKADCEDGASCLVECRTGSTCDFGTCSAPLMCPGKVAVCNRLCP